MSVPCRYTSLGSWPPLWSAPSLTERTLIFTKVRLTRQASQSPLVLVAPTLDDVAGKPAAPQEAKQIAQLGNSIDVRTSPPWGRQYGVGPRLQDVHRLYCHSMCRDPPGHLTERPVSAEAKFLPRRWKTSLETNAACPIDIHQDVRLRHCAFHCRRLPFDGAGADHMAFGPRLLYGVMHTVYVLRSLYMVEASNRLCWMTGGC